MPDVTVCYERLSNLNAFLETFKHYYMFEISYLNQTFINCTIALLGRSVEMKSKHFIIIYGYVSL